MRMRTRKLLGAFALLALVTTWALVAMAATQAVLASTSGILVTLYYAVLGIGWVLPAMPLIRWMSRPDRDGHPPR